MSASLAIAARPAPPPSAPAPSAPTPSAPTMAAAGTLLRIPANQEIFAEGDEAGLVYTVRSGIVRACKFLSDGRRHIDSFHLPGDMFGHASGRTHHLSAEAVTACTLIAWRPGLAAAALGASLLDDAMRHLARAQNHAILLGRANAAQKLAAFLLELAERTRAGQTQPAGMIELPMTRQDIADYLGLTIETVSRTLSQFERDGLIALATSRRIRLADPTALADIAR